ncbi:hypothetical protein F5B20DRAFT_567879 [Whalleya microplaca]|nr:hypothetical protein F5B20DRAFT_567879 [Whalleya microplaca]
METSSRRKACDTCFKKKIKCDMLKPTCSNCLLYNVPCSTTTIRRRTAPANPSQKSQNQVRTNENSIRDGDSIEARLARIEAKLDNLGDASAGMTLNQILRTESSQDEEYSGASAESTPVALSSDASRRHDEYAIPPLTEILPIIEDYFRHWNSAWPLFNQHCFMKMLSDFYSNPASRSKVAWAAINVVLAMGYRIRTVEGEIAFKFNDEKVKRCIDNAQMVLDELVTREEDTLGIQIILGLVLLSQISPDQKPSSVLIGPAMRLAHSLELHMKSALVDYPPDIARQRSTLFWLCYILDKDISLRTKTPSIQLDSDVDLELPKDDWQGCYLQSTDGRSQFNYLRARVQLAHLEGKIYDELYSNRSMKLPLEARTERVLYLNKLLIQWRQTIPTSLQLEHITESLERAPLAHMIILYHTYFVCLAMVNGVYSINSPWFQALGGYCAAALINFDRHSTWMRRQQPPLPDGWATCVDASRGCLKILARPSYSGCNMWLSSCAYYSALLVLLANLLYFPLHELADYDRKLATDTMGSMEKLLDHTGSNAYRQLHTVLVGLKQAGDHMAEGNGGFGGPHELPAPMAPADYAPYPSSQIGVFENSSDQISASQFQLSVGDTAWLDSSTFDSFDINIGGISFDNGGGHGSTFMEEFGLY